jgi:hypothetical protein
LPSPIFSKFKSGRASQLVYVHSHNQHFKQTVESRQIVSKGEKAVSEILNSTTTELDKQIKNAITLENDILKVMYPNQNGDLRETYKEQIRKAILGSPLTKTYLDTHNMKKSLKDGFAKGYKELDNIKGQTGRKAAVEKYVKSEINEFTTFMQKLDSFTTMIFRSLEKLYDAKHFDISFLSGTIARIQSFFGKEFAPYVNKPGSSRTAMDQVKDISDKMVNYTTIGQLNGGIEKILKLVNGTLYELLVAFSIMGADVHARDTFEKEIFSELVNFG